MNVKVTIPTSLKDIKLSTHQKFIKEVKDEEDVNVIHRKMVSIFCKVPEEYVNKIVKKDYDNLVANLTKVLSEEPKETTTFKLNGVKYGLVHLDTMTVGEQADLDSMYADYDKRAKVMSILYRPIKAESRGKYLIEDYTGKEQELDLNMNIVKGADVFFYNILKDCMNYIQNYIAVEAQNTQKYKSLGKNGTGIKTYMPYLEDAFSSLKKQLKYY